MMAVLSGESIQRKRAVIPYVARSTLTEVTTGDWRDATEVSAVLVRGVESTHAAASATSGRSCNRSDVIGLHVGGTARSRASLHQLHTRLRPLPLAR